VTVHHLPTRDHRLLICTQCHTPITVYEIPRPFINPDTYKCGHCQHGTTPDLLEPGEETHRYDPAQAPIPY